MAQNIKGITVQINGDTSGLEKALSDTNKSISTTNKELKEVEKGLKLDPKNVTLLAQKQELLSNAIKDTSKKLESLKKIKEEAEKSNVDKNTKEWRDLERQIIATENQLKSYKNQQDKVDDGFVEGKQNLDSYDNSLLSQGANLGGLITVMGAVINVAKQVVGAMADIITSSAEMADEVNTLAKQYNLTTKQIQIYRKAQNLIDVDLNTITKSMSKLTKNMTSNSKDVQKAFKDLGIVVKDNNGELRDSNEVFNETIAALAKVKNETEQDSIAMQIFGKSAADLGPLINGGAEQLKEFSQYLEENALLLSDDELNALNDVQDGIDKLGATADSIKEKVALAFAPIITSATDTISEFLVDHQDEISELVESVVTWLTSDDTKDFFSKLGQAVKDLDQIVSDLYEMAEESGLLKKIGDFLNWVLDTAIKILDTVAQVISLLKEGAQIKGLDLGWGTAGYGMSTNADSTTNSLGFGDIGLKSGGFTRNNAITINVTNNGKNITTAQIKGWAKIINEELGREI